MRRPNFQLRAMAGWQVLVNWISDAASDEIGITLSTFALGMTPRFKDTTPLEMFDLCAAIIREHVAKRQNDEAKRPEAEC